MSPGPWILALLRTWRGRFIAAFVLLQLALPLHYYVARKDRHDERFAWRMFSPMRMVTCSDPADLQLPPVRRRPPRFTVDDEAVVLGAQFHEAWLELAKRGRYAVLEKIGATLCDVHLGSEVHMAATCVYLDGTHEQLGGWDMCKIPEL